MKNYVFDFLLHVGKKSLFMDSLILESVKKLTRLVFKSSEKFDPFLL